MTLVNLVNDDDSGDTEKREAMRLFPQHLLHGNGSSGIERDAGDQVTAEPGSRRVAGDGDAGISGSE